MLSLPQGPCAITFPRNQLLTLDTDETGPVVLEALNFNKAAQEWTACPTSEDRVILKNTQHGTFVGLRRMDLARNHAHIFGSNDPLEFCIEPASEPGCFQLYVPDIHNEGRKLYLGVSPLMVFPPRIALVLHQPKHSWRFNFTNNALGNP
ncbi:unnamed protein product [Rhizoctonia solani]|uniref:Uncharacterized protein n=3 Tax=Rhizoctonia solani TaxID=456999 RepID=A0A8H3GXJ6_9AGAM|nr:hypothetical protein RSOL_461490 [Rhizoctonia solani AG-3 Rhs1AP]KEP47869.1 hypothetical protein V565_141300 [Rhizoctonia solani 123E]CAE6471340.1 unnamed protein product [Rhizoctonia solani]CAE6513164.1 unnamed protein product [Rhizoctonia solani]